jgi:hypothetical protein
MSLSSAPKLIKSGLAIVDPVKGGVERIVPLQYNPEKLSRSLQARDMGDDADHSERMRLTGPPIETLTLEADIDAIDALERGDIEAAENGIASHLAALELLLSPSSSALMANNTRASSGELDILPMTQKLSLFIWGRNRILPVRITGLSITEEGFDALLNPIRASINLTMRVLTVDDLGFEDRGGGLFINHLIRKEQLSQKFQGGKLSTLGIGDI